MNSSLAVASEEIPAAVVEVSEKTSENVPEKAPEKSMAPDPAAKMAAEVTGPVTEDDSEDPVPEKAAIVTDAISGNPSGAGLNDLLQMIVSFVLVIGLLMFMLWGIKRWQPRLAPGRSGMSVKSVLSLGGRDRLVVVQAGERQILLGVSPGNITLLGDYDELLPPPPAPEGKEPSTSAVDAFRKLLKR